MRILIFALTSLSLFALDSCGGQTTPTLSITTTDFAFTPNTWTVNADERVTLRLTNQSNTEHEWVLLKAGAQVTLPFDDDDEARIEFESEVKPGAVKVSFFRAPAKPGVFRIVCGIAGHLEAGMQGTLIVN
jgi:uncharacterized cupredoxin-like copper-binding protein